MLTIPPTTKLWFAAAVDLRLGFDRLANLVRTQLSADPLSGHLFVFTNRSANRVKVLYWGGYGYCLWCSRLEAGRYHFPEANLWWANASGRGFEVQQNNPSGRSGVFVFMVLRDSCGNQNVASSIRGFRSQNRSELRLRPTR